MINRVILIGRIARDIELRTTATGKNVADFSVAVQKRIKPTDGSPEADFFRCIAWSQQADFISNYGGKGRLVAVDGRLQTRRYQDSSGNAREVVEIVAENVQLLDRPREEGAPTPAARTQDRDTSLGGFSVLGGPAPDEYDPFADG